MSTEIASTSTFTLRQKILIAAASIEGPGPTREDIAARAWERFPEAFCMKRYALPDTNAVYAKLFGTDGLVSRGLLDYEDGAFSVTSKGRALVRVLLKPAPVAPPAARHEAPPPTPPAASTQPPAVLVETRPSLTFTPAELAALHALRSTRVAERVTQPRALSLSDAMTFWGLRPRHLDAWSVADLRVLPASQRAAIEAQRAEATARIVETDALLTALVERTRDTPVTKLPDAVRDVGLLLHAHRMLRGRFGRSFGAAVCYAGGCA